LVAIDGNEVPPNVYQRYRVGRVLLALCEVTLMRYRGCVRGPAASAIAAPVSATTVPTTTSSFAAKTSHQKEAKQ
jgi:hypothetical protein